MNDDKKGWGSTVLGWFIVREGDADAPPAPSRPPAGAAADTVPAAAVAPAPPAVGTQVDFDAVFEAAGIGAEERRLFARAAGLIANLPEGAEPDARKKIVEASLKAFDIPIDRIIETGAHGIQTLEGYVQEQAARSRKVAEESQRLVADYEAKIREVQALLGRLSSEQAAIRTSCNARKLDIQKVLEFFGRDAVARVVRESPRLVDPAASGRES